MFVTGSSCGFSCATDPRAAVLAAAAIVADGDLARVVQRDLSARDDIRRVTAEAWEALGRIDVLVNNAGINYKKLSVESFLTNEWNADDA